MSQRALINQSELRRWARISREEGVAIRGRIDAGGLTIIVEPAAPSGAPDDDDSKFDEQIKRFLRK